MKKRILALLIAVTITSMSLAGCGENEATASVSDSNANSLLVVESTMPQVTDINIMGEYVGTLEYTDQVNVFPILSGEITETFFEEGDYVEEGQLMFTLDDKAYQLQLQNANKTYQSAENGLEQQLGALEMQRNSAVNNVDTAKEGISQIEDSKNYYDDQKQDITDNREDLQKQRNDLKEDLNKLRDDREDAEDELDDAKKAMEDAASTYYAAKMAKDQQDALPPEQQALIPPAQRITKTKLDLLEAGMNGASQKYSGIAQAIAAYNSAEPQLESAIKQLDSTMSQLDSSKESLQFQQDNLDYSLAQAKRGEILAQNNLDYFDNFTAPKTQEAAEITLSQAKIGISSAQLQLSYTKVTAPVSGKVLMKNNEAKDLAQAGYPVYVILPENTKYASFNVPEAVWSQLQVGDKVTVERNGVEYNATISEIPTSINPQVGMFTIKAAISGDTEDLVTGTSVVVKARTNSVANTITIPIDCVYYEGGNSYTFIVSDDGIVSKVYIETGLYDDKNMEIKSGITPDMKLVSTWSSDLHDGLQVKVENDN